MKTLKNPPKMIKFRKINSKFRKLEKMKVRMKNVYKINKNIQLCVVDFEFNRVQLLH